MSFVQFTDPAQGREIYGQWIARARLGLFIRLVDLVRQISRADSPPAMAALLADYFSLCGFEPGVLSGLDQLAAYSQLVELNQPTWLAAFQKWNGDPEYKAPPYDYEGRKWAWWVHKLASRYGWTRDEILELWPEEAAAYLQEVIIAEYDEADERRSLSKLAYHTDQSNTMKFRPLPRPGWIIDPPRPKQIRIRRDMLPVGNVIDLSNLRDVPISPN